MFIRFDMIYERDKQTDGQTPHAGIYRANIASRGKNRRFRPIFRFIYETIQDMATVTMEDELELVCNLSNDAIFNDHGRPLTHISRSCQYSMPNM